MSTEKTEAIVIRQVDFSESSRVVTFYSKEFGKLSSLAKGAKRLKGPFDAALDLLSNCRIVFIRKSSGALHLLTQASLVSRFAPIPTSLNSLYGGYYLADLICSLTEEEDPDTQIFDLAIKSLNELADEKADLAATIVGFEIGLLHLIGLFPNLQECSICSEPITITGKYAHWVSQGGLLCGGCRKQEYKGKSVSAGSIALLRRMTESQSTLSDRIRLTKEQSTECHKLAVSVISQVLGKNQVPLDILSSSEAGASDIMNNCRTQNYRTDSVATDRTPNKRSTSSPQHICAQSLMLVVVCLSCVSGCRSFRPSDGEGLFAKSDLLSTDNIRGPLERVLYSEDEDPLTKGRKFSANGRRQVEAARKQYDDGKYMAALKNYKAIANKYEESAIGEEAWFRMGECHFALKQYPQAQDSYDKLFADYPSTKYVSDASQRLFSIARIWLEVSEPASKSHIKTVSQQVELDKTAKTNASAGDPSVRYGLIPNFFDKTRPLLDTRGRARKALKSVWLNDPTGPIADDALMLTASYYLRRGNNIEADRYFEILRQEYPESPHLEEAFVLGSHAKQMSYQGPHYDKTSLVSAKNLKEQTLSLFPNSDSREQVREDLKKLYLYEAQAAWSQVQFYQQKDNPAAIAIACQKVIEDFPDTRYAESARRTILRIDPAAYRKLPGLTDFVKSLPTQSVAPQRSQENSSGTRVKSVSSPSDNKRRFRLPGF